MYTGIGIGGPRNGVKLSAQLSWDGRVRDPSKPEGAVMWYHKGRYKWSEEASGWVWHSEAALREGRSARPSGHSKKP